MGSSIRVRAHAKVNLHLRVGPRRADGYHDLETIFQSVSLADVITVTLVESREARVTVDPDPGIDPAQNLALRAARSALAHAKSELSPQIHIEKRIPIGAGMGGGSADAAGVLVAVNRLLGEPLKVTELAAIGLSIGADVPFCLTGGTAKARGVGEKLAAIMAPEALHLVVIHPAVPISTPWAYRALDAFREAEPNRSEKPSSLEDIAGTLGEVGPTGLGPACENSFELVVFPAHPVTREARDALLESGARWAMLSGSGSAVFGVFESKSAAAAAAASLAMSRRAWAIHGCTGVTRGVEVC